MRICVLASGSKGNSTYVETNNHKILFDMGTNLKYIKERLEELEAGVRIIRTAGSLISSAILCASWHADTTATVA